MTKYTITLKTAEELGEINGMPADRFECYGGKTLSGFTKITGGLYKDDYMGMFAEDGFAEEVAIFLADEIAIAVAVEEE